MWVFNAVVTILAAVLCVGLFMLLPAAVIKFLGHFVNAPGFAMTLTEGLLKIAIFILYLFLVTRMSDIHRVFEYHGAEHKTIACYEAGDELTPENAKKYVRFHPRCGTSFLLVVIILGIFVGLFIQVDNTLLRFCLRLLLLPVIVCVAYELNRWAGRHDTNIISRIVTWPGKQLQRLTTNEPDDGMIECAIRAMELVIPEEKGKDAW